MYSNFNVLVLPMSADSKYKIGDKYKVPERPAWNNWRHKKFDGLTIKNIDYLYGLRLHFDFKEWEANEA